METFVKLRRLRQVQKRTAAFLRTVEDFDIIVEIGAAQDERRPIGTTVLLAAKLAPRATISRRLSELKKLGVVRQESVPHDKRRSELSLDPSVRSSLERLLRLIC